MEFGTLSFEQLLLIIVFLLALSVQIYFSFYCDVIYQIAIPVVLFVLSFVVMFQLDFYEMELPQLIFIWCIANIPTLFFIAVGKLVVKYKKNLMNK